TRPEAKATNDRGRLPDSFPVEHMLLQLKRAPELEREFEQHIDSLTDKSSPNFRQWITAAEQGENTAEAQPAIYTICNLLESHGFTVGYVYPNHMVMDFSDRETVRLQPVLDGIDVLLGHSVFLPLFRCRYPLAEVGRRLVGKRVDVLLELAL